jgi:hypothetical protein
VSWGNRRLRHWDRFWRVLNYNVTNEAIAAARDRRDVSRISSVVSMSFPKRADMEAKATLINRHACPDLGYEVTLADNIPRTFREHDEELESAAAKPQVHPVSFEAPLCPDEPKWTEGNRLAQAVPLLPNCADAHSYRSQETTVRQLLAQFV